MKEKSILIVDDNRDWAELIIKILENKGHRVSYTDSGEGCLKNLENSIPDLLILDVVLPDISGYELLNKIKSDSRYGEMIVIIISGEKNRPGDLAFGKELGADAYLTKPINNKDFLARIENLLEIKDLESEKENLKVNFDFIFRNTKDILFSLDINGYITSINDAIEKHTGLKSTEFITKQFRNFIEKKEREEWEKFFMSIQSGNYTPPEIFTFLVPGKSIRTEITMSPVFTKNIMSGTLGIARVLKDGDEKIITDKTKSNHDKISEKESFEKLSKYTLKNTAEIYNKTPLKKYAFERYLELKDKYAQALEKSIEERFYKVAVLSSEILQEIALELGKLKSGPEDIIDIHKDVLEDKIQNSPSEKIYLYYEEGRIILIKLMGYLINFYKNYYIK